MNFEKLFTDFAAQEVKKRKIEPSHEAIDELYDLWKETPSAILNGETPAAYVSKLAPAALIAAFREAKCEIIISRIAEVPECAPFLKEIIETETDDELVGISIDLLSDMGGEEPLDKYLELAAQNKGDLSELAIERLKDNADAAMQEIFGKLDGADMRMRTIYAEILCEAKHDDRTLKLLTDLFVSGENTPLYASYIGRYGDERAAAVLYRALDKADYADYIEIKNAIERLGGTVDDDMRSFIEDPYYKLIKGEKN